ncbi:hypothetical protein F5Y12DRAFT_333535 [Xylaria sp. FL1777]|nr:hypothetical protein F5Y12DRAFT_333535 [Xylaria sp. FL1777]
MAVLISEYVAQCLQDFQAASLKSHKLSDDARQKLLDEFARFKLWTGNIGAHRRDRSSLDWRLRDASHLRDLVVNLLTDLKSTLHDVLPILDKNPNTHVNPIGNQNSAPIAEYSLSLDDFDEVDEETEVIEIAADIGDIIGCLLRLSVSIRNPAPHDHFMSSKFIDTSYFEEYDVEHVKAKLPRVNPALARRLGKAISQRRQYFKYREAHHHKLNAGLDLDSKRSVAGAQSTIASSIPTALKDGEKSHPAFGQLNEEERSNSGASQTSYASSGPESGRLKIPPLPKQAGDGPFECLFCYMMISVSTTIQWRKHVNADLRPYICLELDCLTSEQQYAKRHEWLNHLDRKHWRIFRCPYSCHEADFNSRNSLERHLRQTHSEVSSQRDLSLMFDLCERPRPWPEETQCPLCQQTLYSKREYARHVGRHQTELALFALPNNGEEDRDEEDAEDSLDDIAQHSNKGKHRTGDESDYESAEPRDSDSGLSGLELSPEPPAHSAAQQHDKPALPNLDTTSSLNPTPADPKHPNSPNADDEFFVCEECGRAFDGIHKLNHHKRYHDRRFECNYPGCDKRFGTRTHLDRHINDKHLKTKKYHCPEIGCPWAAGGKSFPRKDNYRRHMIKKHGYTGTFMPEELDLAEPGGS